MEKSKHTYLYNMHTEGHILIINNSNIHLSVSAGQRNPIQSKYLSKEVSKIFRVSKITSVLSTFRH